MAGFLQGRSYWGPGPLLQANFRTRGLRARRRGSAAPNLSRRSSKPPGTSGPAGAWPPQSRTLQWLSGAFRGLQGPSKASRMQAGQAFKQALHIQQLRGLQELQKSPAGASRPRGPAGASHLFQALRGLSTYANEEVLLLIKMELTEFRS